MALGNPVFANDKNFGKQPPQFPGAAPQGYPQGYPGAPTQGYAQQGYAPTGYAPGQQPLSPEQLQQMYNQPPASNAQMGRMTVDDVIVKTIGTLLVVLVGAGLGWVFPVLALPGAIIGLVLGLVNSFKREPSKVLILTYALFEGMFLGGISGILENLYSGIVVQAVLGTLIVFALTLVLYKSGKFRATPKMTKFFMIALGGYAIFSLVNFGLMMFNVTNQPWGLRSVEVFGIPLGVIIGILAIGLAAFSLMLDFTSIEQGVKNGLPAKYSWSAAFGLTVTLVWLYVEILRVLAILRGND
ncbi:putative YccA/Bax inhibitor family protein [Psychromicrobium silvestre]|uniref:Putative YccA/Bax inhibitor family protein n=1 Tax=Psychromicrobium silvestre TaxID=1645614 RepID=A0A7Y9S903_9MICC|nr:Bax inhibitor-1/YccA family protein [Psychromicrobium silvestre]NYE96516.1 putative YccA/Bax inhibitor family protein [Psychromicrobium silvestre]